ncbi:MAG: TfoX/Sxy family protein [Hyphomonadaceae bacterium]|nr:TfoX/Sxy family protein [Clostridia bacterium]
MGVLTELPNIGKVSESRLNEVGIFTQEQFRQMGSKEAFVRIRVVDTTACLHMLYGLQGAIEGVKDSFLSVETKGDLKAFYRML